MHPLPSILLLHPNAARRTAIAGQLAGRSVYAVENREEAALQLARVAPEMVVADGSDARRLMKDVDQLAPSAIRVFLCAFEDPEAVQDLVRVASEGHVFHTLDSALSLPELSVRLDKILQSRTAARIQPARPTRACFELRGKRITVPVMDISTQGLSVEVDALGPLAELIPGTPVENIQLFQDDVLILQLARGEVRHVGLFGAVFRMGIALDATPAAVTRELVIQDPVRILAMLRRASLRAGNFQLRPADPKRPSFTVRTPALRSAGGRWLLEVLAPPGLMASLGEVLDLAFDFSGLGFRGLVSIVERSGGTLSLSIPGALAQMHRRKAARFAPRPDFPVVVSFLSPISHQRVVRRAVDLHGSGLTLLIDAAREALPPGLILKGIVLTFPDGTAHTCDAEVRGARPREGEAPGMQIPFRCGLELRNISASFREAVFREFVSSVSSSLSSVAGRPFASIWRLMADSKRQFLDYSPALEGEHLAVLANAQTRLTASQGVLGKSFVATDGDRVVGHANGLRLYSRTWMLQHLTVLPGFHRANTLSQKLSSLVFEYGESLEDIEYIRCMWFTATRWTNRLSGWIAQKLDTPGLTHLRHVNYMHLAPGAEVAVPPTANGARVALPEDLLRLESLLKTRGELVALRAEDLACSELRLRTLQQLSARHGIERHRSVFAVDGPEGAVGFALAEHATPGLTWPEFTNSFRFILSPHSTAPMGRALLQSCLDAYRARGQRFAVALCADNEVELFKSAGFTFHGRIVEWTSHKSLARQWQSLASGLFEHLARRQPSLEEEGR